MTGCIFLHKNAFSVNVCPKESLLLHLPVEGRVEILHNQWEGFWRLLVLGLYGMPDPLLKRSQGQF